MNWVIDASVALKWFLRFRAGEDHSRRYGHHLFETLYHALALLHPEAVLVTADRRYFVKAQREGSIMLSENFTA
ncbi:hypothetical protein ACQAYK_07835 [Acidithiobacillus sp. AC3]